MFRCLGILREVQHSPNRENDDALILEAVLAQMEKLGAKTALCSPTQLDAMPQLGEAPWDAVLPMCESYPRLMRLMPLAARPGALWINGIEVVLNCYRTRMVPILARAGVRFPPSEVRAVKAGPGEPPGFPAPEGWWIKRGDVHNTCDRDVARAGSWKEVSSILGDFAQREVTHWIVQPHLDGDLIKFYGVGPGHWLTWFHHDSVRARRIPFAIAELADQAAKAAAALGLEIFGGDAIISPNGRVTLIDMNSWPSFALVREAAAVQISWHIQNRLSGRKQAEESAARRKE